MIIPFFGDQFFWADRVKSLGIGLAEDSWKNITPSTLAQSIIALLSSKRIQQTSAFYGEMVRAQDGVSRAVDIFHNILSLS